MIEQIKAKYTDFSKIAISDDIEKAISDITDLIYAAVTLAKKNHPHKEPLDMMVSELELVNLIRRPEIKFKVIYHEDWTILKVYVNNFFDFISFETLAYCNSLMGTPPTPPNSYPSYYKITIPNQEERKEK